MKYIKGYFELLESSISSVRSEDILTKDKIIELILYGDFYENLYKRENNLDSDEEIDEEDFDSWVNYELELKIEELLRFYKREVIKGGNVTVFRKMTVKENWINHLASQGKHLGVYWTWDPDSAEAHWGYEKGKEEVLIEAEVAENGVDWKGTIEANIRPYTGEDEREILLNRGTPVLIKSIEIDGKLIDIIPIQDKKFFA